MHSESYSTWSCLCACVCVCPLWHHRLHGGPRAIPTALVLHRHGFKKGDFSETTVFKNYGVKHERKSQLLMSTASPRPVFAALHTVEASKVTQRSSRESKPAFKRTYKYSYPVGVRNNRLWAHDCGLYTFVYIAVTCVCALYIMRMHKVIRAENCTSILAVESENGISFWVW